METNQMDRNKEKEKIKQTGKCCLCGDKYTHYGNNSQSLMEGRCCDKCNYTKVIPERFRKAGICRGKLK